MAEHRLERINQYIQQKIGELIVSGKIKDPRVDTLLSITRVEGSRDLSYADVYVSTFKSERALHRGIAGLQHAAGFIQSQLNLALHIRQTPRLRFHEDHSIQEGFEIIKKIEGLHSESGD